MKNKLKLIPTIGLEVHAELRTESKMFCGCPSYHFAKPPNTQTCPVCLGLPGALPVANIKAVEWTIMIGHALNCKISNLSKFDRKHYSYPDLPKGYQISQYDEPVATNGWLEISGNGDPDIKEGDNNTENKQSDKKRKIRIRRVHIEEDTGKLQHTVVGQERVSLVDFNRSGVALVEIVTEPDIASGRQAKEFAQTLQKILRFLGVTDADMEKGSMRLEANISLGLDLGYKVEVKNLNSFRFLEKAIEYELERQRASLEKGITPKQETRGWDEVKNVTIPQRFKESEADYRYFPEPDIPPMEFTDEYIAQLKRTVAQLPEELEDTFVKEYGLSRDYAKILSSDKDLADYGIKTLKLAVEENVNVKDAASVIINKKVDIKNTSPEKLVKDIAKNKSGRVEDVDALSGWVDTAIEQNEKAVNDFLSGKENAVGVLVGSVMKLSKGKADAKAVRDIIASKLSKS